MIHPCSDLYAVSVTKSSLLTKYNIDKVPSKGHLIFIACFYQMYVGQPLDNQPVGVKKMFKKCRINFHDISIRSSSLQGMERVI